MAGALLEFVSAHGPLEITLILTTAAAGLGMGHALIAAEDEPRRVILAPAATPSSMLVDACPGSSCLGLVEARSCRPPPRCLASLKLRPRPRPGSRSYHAPRLQPEAPDGSPEIAPDTARSFPCRSGRSSTKRCGQTRRHFRRIYPYVALPPVLVAGKRAPRPRGPPTCAHLAGSRRPEQSRVRPGMMAKRGTLSRPAGDARLHGRLRPELRRHVRGGDVDVPGRARDLHAPLLGTRCGRAFSNT